jgi:hypothetical protein
MAKYDGTDRQDRPFTVTEQAYGLRKLRRFTNGRREIPDLGDAQLRGPPRSLLRISPGLRSLTDAMQGAAPLGDRDHLVEVLDLFI